MSYEVIPDQAICSGRSTIPWVGPCNSSSDSGRRRRNFSRYSARSSATEPERPLDVGVLPPAEAEDLLNAYYRHRQEAAVAGQPSRAQGRRLPGLDLPFFELPRELADSHTIGVIHDEVDGLNFYADYRMLRDLFADPAVAGRRQHQDLLRAYLREESIAPLPIHRLAAAHPETTDAVFRKLLRKPGFTWSEHGEALLRRRKPWYYANKPCPGASVIGDRLSALGVGR